MIETAACRSEELFESGSLCAESVLVAVTEELGLTCKLIPRMATGFCSGLARTGGLCGAVGGAVIALGIVAGRDGADEPVDPTYALVRAVLERFEDRFGATTCRELTGCDLATDGGQEQFRESGQHARCVEYVREATRMVLEALDSKGG
jgi:C_GCAxxG_C_C family probable redox protein